jgi:hypothetical protein
VLQLAGKLHSLASASGIVSGVNRTLTPKSQSFAAELTDRLAGSGKGAQQPSVLPVSLPVGQSGVSWRNPGSSSNTQPSGLSGLVITYPATPGATGGTTAASPQPTSFDDAYWAKQPAAVQQLRNIQDPAQRTELAVQLAQQGYAIDAPIMISGWDPQIATQLRQSQGYTWVPSALQQPVEVAPGLSVAGLQSYDPAHPPAGSIAV